MTATFAYLRVSKDDDVMTTANQRLELEQAGHSTEMLCSRGSVTRQAPCSSMLTSSSPTTHSPSTVRRFQSHRTPRRADPSRPPGWGSLGCWKQRAPKTYHIPIDARPVRMYGPQC